MKKIIMVFNSYAAFMLSNLYRTPNLLDGIIASFFFKVGTYDAVSTEVALTIYDAVFIYTLDTFVGQIPQETSCTTGIICHNLPVIGQSGTMSAIIESV